MAKQGVNKVILVGNVGQEPDVKATQGGSQVVNLSIATSETWNDNFGKLAEIVSSYVNKGSKLYVEGSLRTRKWQDNNGQDRYTTEIVGSEMQMLDSRGQSGQPSQAPSAPAPQNAAPQATPIGGMGDFTDDSIPF